MCLHENVRAVGGGQGQHMSSGPAYRLLLDFGGVGGTRSDFNKFAKKTFSWAAYE